MEASEYCAHIRVVTYLVIEKGGYYKRWFQCLRCSTKVYEPLELAERSS